MKFDARTLHEVVARNWNERHTAWENTGNDEARDFDQWCDWWVETITDDVQGMFDDKPVHEQLHNNMGYIHGLWKELYEQDDISFFSYLETTDQADWAYERLKELRAADPDWDEWEGEGQIGESCQEWLGFIM